VVTLKEKQDRREIERKEEERQDGAGSKGGACEQGVYHSAQK